MRRLLLGFSALLASCNGCSKDAPKGAADAGEASVVAEVLPRCRADAARVVIPGDDVLAGEVAVSAAGILVGVVRREGQRRLASVVRAPLDLGSVRVVDVGPARGDDPPPAPRWNGGTAYAAFFAEQNSDTGWVRIRSVHDLGDASIGKLVGNSVEQRDESTAFDVAWTEGEAAPLAAWDEDAPPKGDGGVGKGIERGFVKVRKLLAVGEWKFHVVSPETSDAELPRLLPRPGGYWVAWLSRRTEHTEGSSLEGPGEKRAFRWVEVVAVDAKGEPAGPVRRVSPEKGHAVAFELAKDDAGKLVVLVQDEAAATDGAGGRIVRHVVGDHIETADVVDSGVGHAIAELVRGGGVTFLAWNDAHDRAQLLPLGPDLSRAAPSTEENLLDGARVIGAAPPDHLFAIAQKDGVTELRRFVCAPSR